MGASDSKLVFKQGIFKLSEPQAIAADDEYWTGFWELPESAEDVFTLFSPADIRRTRDSNLGNLETLILAVTSKLFVLKNHPSFPSEEFASEREVLNCVRVLTRILPFIYEADRLEEWEERFFWATRRRRTRRGKIGKTEVLFDDAEGTPPTPVPAQPEYEEVKPLAEELLDTLVDLLFFSEFTLPKTPPGKPKVSYAIWQTGVGCHTPITSTKEFENNRAEVLRLLLVMCSRAMYMSPTFLPVKGVRAITYLTTIPDKQIVLSTLCSLMNTTLKYNPASWRVPYDHMVFKDNRQLLVTYCLQLLLVLVLYPIPETQHNVAPKNYFRHFLGRLHRPQDFQFIVDGMTRILNQPLQASNSYLPGSQKSIAFAPEMLMLFWEALQCNKRFRSFIINTERAHDFTVLVLFYALDQRSDPSHAGIVRMCVFILQTMSVEPNYGKSLNVRFKGQETLPQSIRIPNFHGTYADYLITSIYTLLTSTAGKAGGPNHEAIYPALLAIINNIAPYLEGIGRATSSKLLNLFASMSSPSFLLANESNHSLLQSLLEALNAMLEHQFQKNPNLVFAVLKAKRRFQALREFSLEAGQQELERMAQQRKEAQEAASLRLARTNSVESARSPLSRESQSAGNHLQEVPEDGAFTIGDDDDDEEDENGEHDEPATPATPQSPASPNPNSQASRSSSRAASVSDETVPLQLRGMSEKARGKMPVGAPLLSRTNSVTSVHSLTPVLTNAGGFQPTPDWIESWQPELPLHSILTILSELPEQIPAVNSDDTPTILAAISSASLPIEQSPIRVHLFEWSPLSLGWYESLLWGFIFASEMLVSRGTAGVWNKTTIKLFRVQETAAQAPSLASPRGAVDAVGGAIVNRIGSLNLRGAAASAGNLVNGTGGGGQMRVRDV